MRLIAARCAALLSRQAAHGAASMRRLAALAASVAAALAAGASLLVAQGTAGSLQVSGPTGNPVHDGTPRFTISTSGFTSAELPLRLELQVALSASFAPPLWADTTVTGSSATIVVPRLLPENTNFWWRVVVRTAQNNLVNSNIVGPIRSSRWLTLTFPNNPNSNTINTRRPVFSWSSPAVYAPVPGWSYTLTIFRSSDGFPVFTATLSDTSFALSEDLESNTSYRWSVAARLVTGESILVPSAATFVITDPGAPIATLLYQNFPNPFPTDRIATTCIWFDLRAQSQVTLEVLDLRGNLVRRLLPGRGITVGGTATPGRYGRAAFGSDAGCDDRLTWDGRDERGRFVPQGAYLIRLRADGRTFQVRAVFTGGR